MRSSLSLLGLMVFAGAITLMSLAFGAPASADSQTTLEYSSTSAPVEFTPVSHHYTVCCKRGRHDWWASRRACWRAGGHVVAARHCRNDWNEVRVCCKRGRYDWWTTPRACRRSGGWQVAGWQCRNG